MIGFMPGLYPDELIYSLMGRYHSRSGHMVYHQTIAELLENPKDRLEIELMNHYTRDFKGILLKNRSMEQLIRRHTMFPAYAMFLPFRERSEVLQSLIQMDGRHRQIHGMHAQGKLPYFRYCPLCVQEDRARYEETYWHRKWQIDGIKVCPKHGCYLEETNFVCNGRAKLASSLVTAEAYIPEHTEVRAATNRLEMELATYAIEVFDTEIDMENAVTVGEYLHSMMEGTRYLTPRGEVRKLDIIYSDLKEYYGTLADGMYTKKARLQDVFLNLRYQFTAVCMLGMFLKSPPEELVNRKLSQKSQQQLFDETVLRLRNQGLKFGEIAERLNAPCSVVKKSYHNDYRKRGPLHSMKKEKKYDWEKLDLEYLPCVKKAVSEIWEDSENAKRPRRVTIYGVEQKMGFYQKKFDQLPRCKEEIEKHYESYPQFWAREVIWAVKQIMQEGETVSWQKLARLTSLRKKNLQACMPYLDTQADPELMPLLKKLL